MVCRILLLFILTSLVSGSFVVNVTQTSYQAEENHNITLEWKFTVKPDRSLRYLSILCELIRGQDIAVLYHIHEGAEVSESQDQKFSGRVQSDKDALREGRIRLQVSRLRTDDSGLYLCEVNTDFGFGLGKCQLNITAVKDCPEPERKSERSASESRGRIGLYCGLTAALLLLCCCLSLTVFPKKMLDVRPPSSHQTDHFIQFDQHVKKTVGPESNESCSSSSNATKTVPVSTPFSHKADAYLERIKLPT